MNQQKNNSKNKPFGVIDAIRYMMFTAIGLFMSGAGFGGCVVCSVTQGVFLGGCVSLPSNGAYWGHCGYAQHHQHD